MNDSPSSPRIHWTLALIPLAVLVVLQVLVIREFGSDALDGASQTALLVAAAVAVAMGMLFFKVPWKSIDHAISDNVKTIGGAIIEAAYAKTGTEIYIKIREKLLKAITVKMPFYEG